MDSSTSELNVACELDLTVYDGSYLLLADKMRTAVITADDKLYEKAREDFRIIHIKDYL